MVPREVCQQDWVVCNVSLTMSANLSETDQKELNSFLDAEQAKARVQSSVHAFTERCWDQCMTGSIGARSGRGEEACLSNCVERCVAANKVP